MVSIKRFSLDELVSKLDKLKFPVITSLGASLAYAFISKKPSPVGVTVAAAIGGLIGEELGYTWKIIRRPKALSLLSQATRDIKERCLEEAVTGLEEACKHNSFFHLTSELIHVYFLSEQGEKGFGLVKKLLREYKEMPFLRKLRYSFFNIYSMEKNIISALKSYKKDIMEAKHPWNIAFFHITHPFKYFMKIVEGTPRRDLFMFNLTNHVDSNVEVDLKEFSSALNAAEPEIKLLYALYDKQIKGELTDEASNLISMAVQQLLEKDYFSKVQSNKGSKTLYKLKNVSPFAEETAFLRERKNDKQLIEEAHAASCTAKGINKTRYKKRLGVISCSNGLKIGKKYALPIIKEEGDNFHDTIKYRNHKILGEAKEKTKGIDSEDFIPALEELAENEFLRDRKVIKSMENMALLIAIMHMFWTPKYYPLKLEEFDHIKEKVKGKYSKIGVDKATINSIVGNYSPIGEFMDYLSDGFVVRLVSPSGMQYSVNDDSHTKQFLELNRGKTFRVDTELRGGIVPAPFGYANLFVFDLLPRKLKDHLIKVGLDLFNKGASKKGFCFANKKIEDYAGFSKQVDDSLIYRCDSIGAGLFKEEGFSKDVEVVYANRLRGIDDIKQKNPKHYEKFKDNYSAQEENCKMVIDFMSGKT